MTDQPTAEANRYAQLGPEAQALVDDFDACDLAEMLVSKNNDIAACDAQQWPQRLAAAEAELRRYTENEFADAAAGSYAGRAERAEQQRDQLAALVRDFLDPDPCQLDHHGYCQAHLWMCSGSACPHARAREALAALDDESAIAQPEPWLHVTFTSQDATTANTSALALRDHLTAEFPGVGMRISSNAVEASTPKEDWTMTTETANWYEAGCARDCTEQHTYTWGRCALAPESARPEPTVSTSVVYDAADGHKAIGFDTYTVPQLAELIEPALRTIKIRLGPNARGMLERGEEVRLTAGEYVSLALAAADAIVHRNTPVATEATDIETTARVFAALHRSAEDTVTRVIDLYERWVTAGPPPLGVPTARWWDARLVELHDAINLPDDTPTGDQP